MLSIRLSRVGKKKQPSYRLIVCQKTKDPWGTYLENLGNYNPRTNPKTIQLKAERIKYWMSKGAQPSGTVHNLLVDQKIIEGTKVKSSLVSKKRAVKLAERKKSEEASSAKAADAQAAKAEAPAAEVKPEVAVETPVEAPVVETPAEVPAAETPIEAPKE